MSSFKQLIFALIARTLSRICLNVFFFFFVCVCVCVHSGIKESDTGLAPPALWDLAADKQTLQGEQPLQV